MSNYRVRTDEGMVPANKLGITGTFNQFDRTFYVEVAGDPAATGEDPSFPSTLESVLQNQQQAGMLIVCGLGTHAGTFTITEPDVTIRGRLAGIQQQQVTLSGPLNLEPTCTRFVAQNVRFAGDITDTSQGRHRFEEVDVQGAVTYTRTDPRNFVEFLDSSVETLTYVVSGAGGGGTINGADTFLTGATDIGNCQIDTPLHFFSSRSGTTIRRLRSTVFVAAVIDDVVFNSTTADAVDMPAGLLVAGNCRFNGAGALGTITVAQSWLYDCILDLAASSLGTAVPGLGPAVFRAISYVPDVPANWAGVPPKTQDEAINRLIAANPGA